MSLTRRTALLSIGASIVTLLLKFGAYFLTGSVGLLSDAIESFVNLAAALIAFTAITIAGRQDVIFCSFGDMVRVPGSKKDLLAVKAAGGVRDLDALLRVRALGVTRCGATRTAQMMDDARARLGLEPLGGVAAAPSPAGY